MKIIYMPELLNWRDWRHCTCPLLQGITPWVFILPPRRSSVSKATRFFYKIHAHWRPCESRILTRLRRRSTYARCWRSSAVRVWGRGCARPAFHMHLRCATFGNVHKVVRCLRFRPIPDLRGRPQSYPSPPPGLAAPPQLHIRDTIVTLPTLPGPGQTPGPLLFSRRAKVVSLSASGLSYPGIPPFVQKRPGRV